MASNRNVLKKYAPQARVDFIQAITNRAAQFGISKDANVAGEVQGDLFILNGKAFPRSVANQRGRLIARIAREGFAQVMEAVAYTWFNRFLAIRYMELHHFLDHGCRVLSNAVGHGEPEILEKAATIDLPGIDRDEIVNLKLDGTKDEVIYRKLLIAQCNDLHRAMPFLFEKIDDETELLLPENLLQSDSIVRKLVDEIDEAEWQEIEIIGWLYQFYISEKKDQVIGKVVKSEDIPAATQLFTPNWIVKYMVQNSLGAQWLATYPDSGIRSGMEYYIVPAEQTSEVQAQIDAIRPKKLDPEAITLIDPAVGSGHILVEAYDLFRAIYLERGYTKREAARAILSKNLFGLDIDDRAAQMAGFALLMKACGDDRSVLRNPPKLNVLALQDSEGLDADALAKMLLPQERFEMVPSGDLLPETLAQPTLAAFQPTSAEAKAINALVTLFDGAKTFGSLITVPDAVMQSLPLLDALLAKPLSGDLLLRQAQEDAQDALKPLVEQARLLGSRHDCVVANPPYMGNKGMNEKIKSFVQKRYPRGKFDLLTCFMERSIEMTKIGGWWSMINLPSWMFLSSFESFRKTIIHDCTVSSLIHLGRGIFGSDFGTVAFVFQNRSPLRSERGLYRRLFDQHVHVRSSDVIRNLFLQKEFGKFVLEQNDLFIVPGFPIAYWLSHQFRDAFTQGESFGEVLNPRQGLATGSNDTFLRRWYEVSIDYIGFGASSRDVAVAAAKKWFPYNKGGAWRKWYGNFEYVVNWSKDGKEIREFKDSDGNVRSRPQNTEYYFRESITWSDITTKSFAARYSPQGFVFDVKGSSGFPARENFYQCIAIVNSCLMKKFMDVLNPTATFQVGDMARVPFLKTSNNSSNNAKLLIEKSKFDWDCQEVSIDFQSPSILQSGMASKYLLESLQNLELFNNTLIKEVSKLELENNTEFINAYGLNNEIKPYVPLSEITLICNSEYRYGTGLTDNEYAMRLRCDTMRELVSYAVGCMMGRYSLAEPGLIYAHAGGVGFDPSRYGAFPADNDGIIPLTEEQWFADDAAVRIEEFLGISWPEAPVMETLTTLMDGLAMGKAGEPRAALRSYMSKQFYKDHLQTYKNRPIYWLFSSGKQKAFEALVYLHRYNEGTLARMRTVYVTPLMGKLQQRMADLQAEAVASSSSAETTRKNREKDKLTKQVVELRAFDGYVSQKRFLVRRVDSGQHRMNLA